jgi:hypothetical protein
MYIQLVRESFTNKSTEGKLFINGEFECYTLEDKDRFLEVNTIEQKVYAETAIPRGTYNVLLTRSPRFKKVLPLLEDVPYFEGIRIHAGNKPEDSEGCILVGSTNNLDDDDWIGGSKVALKSLMSKMQEAVDRKEEITIEIV